MVPSTGQGVAFTHNSVTHGIQPPTGQGTSTFRDSLRPGSSPGRQMSQGLIFPALSSWSARHPRESGPMWSWVEFLACQVSGRLFHLLLSQGGRAPSWSGVQGTLLPCGELGQRPPAWRVCVQLTIQETCLSSAEWGWRIPWVSLGLICPSEDDLVEPSQRSPSHLGIQGLIALN